MASLNQVLSALMSSIAHGRSQADLATLEIARMYKDDPILSRFPIPRVTMDEINIDLKLAFSNMTAVEDTLTPKSRTKILKKIQGLAYELPEKEVALVNIGSKYPKSKKAMSSSMNKAMEELGTSFPIKKEVGDETIADITASIICKHLNIIYDLIYFLVY